MVFFSVLAFTRLLVVPGDELDWLLEQPLLTLAITRIESAINPKKVNRIVRQSNKEFRVKK